MRHCIFRMVLYNRDPKSAGEFIRKRISVYGQQIGTA